MPQRPIAGVGTLFRRWNGATWDTIEQITSIDGPGMSKETIDVTSLDSVGGYRDFIGSFRDGGEVSLGMNYTRDGYNKMKDDYDSECPVDYEIILPDGGRDLECGEEVDHTLDTTFSFKGIVTELPIAVATDTQVTMNVTIKVSGKVHHADRGSDTGAPVYPADE